GNVDLDQDVLEAPQGMKIELLRRSALKDRFSTSGAIGNDSLAVNGRRVYMSTIYRRIKSFVNICAYLSLRVIELQDLSNVWRDTTGPMNGIKLSSVTNLDLPPIEHIRNIVNVKINNLQHPPNNLVELQR
ncbi:hypothetical protein BDFB_004637, partial [Asbolus verrucosus]